MDDLKLIKKYYGEKMMHLCRQLFPSILEYEGLLFSLMDKHFARSHYLYNDLFNQNKIYAFKNYIYKLFDNELIMNETTKSPQELLDEAGYILYECKTEEDIQSFRKYYNKEKDEELCTFDGGRLETDYVFFAVKKNVSEIKRFENPERQDEYGTSVISIQFSRESNYLSIKNRYNHTVHNPDATFSNNLDNIIPGLTNAFEKTYNFKINDNKSNFEIDGYVYANDEKFYKYSYEIQNVYYCTNNIIVHNGEIMTTYQDKARYLFIDYFIVDLKWKRVFSITNVFDGFLKAYDEFEKIDIAKTNNGKLLYFKINSKRFLELGIDKDGKIISLKDNLLRKIENEFLYYNTTLKTFIAPNLEEIKNCFLYKNQDLIQFYVPKVEKIGDSCLRSNKELKYVYFPNLLKVGNYFLRMNKILNFFMAPKIEKMGVSCLEFNEGLEYLCLDNLKFLGDDFLSLNRILEVFIAPKLKQASNELLECDERLKYIEIPYDSLKYCFAWLLANPNRYEIGRALKDNGVWDKEGYRKILKRL